MTTYATGWIFAWYMVDILKNAATYEGGLDRGNIMLAARNIHETNPLLINGLTSITDGTKDAYLTEGGQMVQYTVTDTKQLGTYQPAGDLINLEGKLGTYKTVQDAAAAARHGHHGRTDHRRLILPGRRPVGWARLTSPAVART